MRHLTFSRPATGPRLRLGAGASSVTSRSCYRPLQVDVTGGDERVGTAGVVGLLALVTTQPCTERYWSTIVLWISTGGFQGGSQVCAFVTGAPTQEPMAAAGPQPKKWTLLLPTPPASMLCQTPRSRQAQAGELPSEALELLSARMP